MKKRFKVTYEVITPESAKYGDAAERGWLLKEPAHLRAALAAWDGIGCHVEADCYPVTVGAPPRWFTAYSYRAKSDRASVNRSLHLPDNITPSSAMRIARLVGCYGVS